MRRVVLSGVVLLGSSVDRAAVPTARGCGARQVPAGGGSSGQGGARLGRGVSPQRASTGMTRSTIGC